MPKYNYYCDVCLEISTQWHGITEKMVECPMCGAKDCLTRVPAQISDFKQFDKKSKVGDVVKENISNAKKELKQQKAEARRGFKDDS